MNRAALSQELLERFLAFCRVHRGSSQGTAKHHRFFISRFFASLREAGITRASRIPAYLIDSFMQKIAASASLSRLHGAASSLRVFFRFLSLHGLLARSLEYAVVTPRKFKDNLRPKFIPWDKVQLLLSRVPRHTRTGKRDFAILSLMVYHGLRSWEIASLQLDDVRWDSNSLFLRKRKTAKAAHLPLAPVTAQALKDFITVRPQVPFPELFPTRRPPYRPLGSNTYTVARRHIQRCFGGSIPHQRGAYRLRHSFAKMLLDQGAPLPQISQLLGHAKLDSTLIYTRVATNDLRQVADNYADLL